jgi:hypothetical protein
VVVDRLTVVVVVVNTAVVVVIGGAWTVETTVTGLQ